MAILRRSDEIPSGLSPILLPGEQLVTAVHSHWARLVKPVSISALALTIAIVVDANLTPATQPVGNALWLLFFITVAWLLWRILEWRNDWFVATDKRLLLRYGIITHKVAMMPLIKVTDMSYVRSISGLLFGYGRFIMESAGQDQALRTVEWVPRPDETYRAICAVIFNIGPPPGTATVVEVDDGPEQTPPDGAGPEGGSGGSGGPGGTGRGGPTDPGGHGTEGNPGSRAYGTPSYPDVPPIHNPIQDRLDQYSRAIPIRRVRGGEPLYESDDIRRRRRSADTGPVPIRQQDRRPRHEPRSD
ncbi:PH domain-containing protein [Intrasporangium calvum]|uniref:PH domain-containing protein n=1 Tax=Intrasporangium calvum TaxID=53358 RepID=UPI000DF5FD67|nr:PH domain-containing protein [Intrasporangium calvum]AXG12223.1 PH domain-containing protein [Intrasporangium calvum]